ncbi:MAG: outer membrane lipoprotein carrier protein LolA [Prolixibacteraceae bacterium]|jgi:outer membrane lipoprotein-sorting protein|nr:outer membrane lipoprotein carrier protein LolA [Prolixibacteraceae bacterium]
MKRVFIFLFLFSSFVGYSQIDQKAKSILDQVSKTTKNYSSISADFEFIMINTEVDINESNKGSLIIQGNSYKLNINSIEIFSDGETQWTYMTDADEVNISEVNTDEESMINPATIFSIYEHGYTNTYLGEFTSGTINTHKIEMVPTEESEFSRVILEINQTNLQIIGATMFGNDGNQYLIAVKNMNTSKTYPNSTFVFDTQKHPNVDVIDMR